LTERRIMVLKVGMISCVNDGAKVANLWGKTL